MTAEKRARLANIDPNAPIDEMPDSQIKYDKIVKKAAEEAGWKYTDAEFTEEKMLGERIEQEPAKRFIKGYKRASEIAGATLYRDGASHRDVVQGNLGDCYFLSAISVLGHDRVEDVILYEQQDEDNYKKTGCFILRFYKEGE